MIDAGESYTFHNALIAKGSKAFSDSFVFSLGNGVTGAAFLFNIGLPGSPIDTFAVTYDGDDMLGERWQRIRDLHDHEVWEELHLLRARQGRIHLRD